MRGKGGAPVADEDDGLLTQYAQAPLPVEELLQMHEANPDNLEVLDAVAFHFYTHDELDRAMEFYKKLLAKKPKHVDAHYRVGNIHFRRKQLVAAMMSWKKVIQLSPDSKTGRNAKARVERAMDKVRDLK